MVSRKRQNAPGQHRAPPFSDQGFPVTLASVAPVCDRAGAVLPGHRSGTGIVIGRACGACGGSGVIPVRIGAWRRHASSLSAQFGQ